MLTLLPHPSAWIQQEVGLLLWQREIRTVHAGWGQIQPVGAIRTVGRANGRFPLPPLFLTC